MAHGDDGYQNDSFNLARDMNQNPTFSEFHLMKGNPSGNVSFAKSGVRYKKVYLGGTQGASCNLRNSLETFFVFLKTVTV